MKSISNPRALARGFSISLVLAAAAAFLPGACSGVTSSHQIGHLAPRSGPDRAAGERLIAAVEMVIDETNSDESNRIEKRPITGLHADTGATPDGFTFQATRLLRVNHVAALLGGVDSVQLGKIAAAVQAQDGAPLTVSPCGGLGTAPSKLLWPVGLNPGERGKALARCATEEMQVADVATITDVSNPVFAAMRSGFEAEFRHADRRISNAWTFAEAGELAALAGRVAAAAPRAILFCGHAADLLQLRDGLSAKQFSSAAPVLFAGEEEEALLRREAARSQGIVYVSAFTTQDDGEKVQKLAVDFEKRAGQPIDADAALSADAARVLFAAARKANTFGRDQLLKELPKLEMELPTGKFWFTREGEPRRTAYALRLERGQPQRIKTYQPEKK